VRFTASPRKVRVKWGKAVEVHHKPQMMEVAGSRGGGRWDQEKENE